MTIDSLLPLWPVLLGIGSLIAWLVRLEGKANDSQRRIGLLETTTESLSHDLQTELLDIKTRLVRIETLLTERTK